MSAPGRQCRKNYLPARKSQRRRGAIKRRAALQRGIPNCWPALVPGLVDKRALLDPWHHRAELLANFLDLVLRKFGPRRLERGLVDLVLQHPVAREFARL